VRELTERQFLGGGNEGWGPCYARDSVLACFLLLSACGHSASKDIDSSDDTDISSYPGQEKGGETYQEYDQRRDRDEGDGNSYAGDGCTVDCSGHDAGYQWAEERSITDPDDCGGKSWSFDEGCRAYAEAQSEEDGEGDDEDQDN